MNILGISCFYHDSGVCLLQDGKIIAAVQEERFNRNKNSPDFPYNAINFCLQTGNITVYDIDYITFYEKPFLKFYRVILNHLRSYPFSINNFLNTVPNWLSERLIIPLILKNEIGYEKEVLFIKHQLSHAASTFLVSPFEEAVILTADGVGEWATMSYGYGEGRNIRILKEIHYPDSLGLLYSAVTTYLGFQALRGEGKVMGLAGWGKPTYLDKLKKIISIRPDGSFHLDSSFFGFNKGKRMYGRKFVKMFGKVRKSDEELEKRHFDIAASLQKIVEEIVIRILRNIHAEINKDKVCLAGGLFLNCVLNHKILEETEFKEVFIQPAAGDSGGAVGAAFYTYNSLLDNPRDYIMENAYTGPSFSDVHIKSALVNYEFSYRVMGEDELVKYIAYQLSKDKIVGWFQGRMEFGPRALGNRSILANPCNPEMKNLVNSKVKRREHFRPYAPSVIEEKALEFFELRQKSPFMLLAAGIKRDKKDIIPAVTHIDGTARIQTVNKKTNSRYWKLINEFNKITGTPVILNTSFNLRGEPIVCTPEDALKCFKESQMDFLVLENYVIEKEKSEV